MRILKLLAVVALLSASKAQNAYVQLIHGVADVVGVNFPVTLDSIDIYISTDGGQNWSLAVPDFKFRQATPYIPLPANSNQLQAGVAPGNSTGPSDILLNYSLPVLSSNVYYIATIAGTIDFLASAVDVDIYYYANARATANSPSQVDLLAFHASLDAGAVAYYWAIARTVHAYIPDGNLSYRAYTPGYKSISSNDVFIVGDSADHNAINGGWLIPVSTNTSLWGNAGVILISGYINTADPAKAIGAHLVLPSGTVVPLSIQEVRRIQIIHNAADPALAQVDIHPQFFPNPSYALSLDFRQAFGTFFLSRSTGSNIPFYFSARGNTTTPIATVNFTVPASGQNVLVFAQGVGNPSQFAANPDNQSTAFTLIAATGARGVAPVGSFSVIPFHGVTDAPTVDVEIVNVGTVSALTYGIRGSAVTLPANTDQTLNIRVGSTVVASFTLSASQARSGEGAAVFASGFLDPAANQNGPAFGLYVAYPDGTVEPLGVTSTLSTRADSRLVQAATWPIDGTDWLITVGVRHQEALFYKLITPVGQIVRIGTWETPGQGTWTFRLSGESLSAGLYLLEIDGQVIKLMR